MSGYHSYIGYPWIIDYLARYDSAAARQKPVPGQVVEFLRMPDCQYPEAVINISDQKYYIRAVITKKAQQILESEDEHFTLADIKNKIIILKNFSVCFTAVEDLRRCEFYLTVQHFSVLPMETNTVDILNCNMEPGVQKKIKELWQNYMTELEMNENSTDMNLSDVSLTQLLMVASEEKFNTLKSIAEKCLELDPLAAQDNSPQVRTFWSRERTRSQETTERLVIPVDLLLIPPHEEALLEQMAEFRYEGQCPSEVAESSEEDNSSQPYSTALSTLSEETIDVRPSSQSGNPWNKLDSLCISVPPSLDPQPKSSHSGAQKRRENEADSDSSSPDISTCVADISMDDSSNDKREISPLLFTEHFSNPQEPSTSKSQTNPHCKQGNLNASIASVSLTHLTQDSPQRPLSMESKVHISPVKSSEIKSNPGSKRGIFSVSDNIDREKFSSPRTRKASKRKQTLEDVESSLSDLEQQEPEYVDAPDCTTLLSGGEIDKVSDNGVQTAISKPLEKREAAVPVSGVQKNHKSSKKRLKGHKPMLQFVCNTKILTTKDSANEQLTAKGLKTSKVCTQEAPAKEAHGQSLPFQAKERTIVDTEEVGTTKLAHRDGTPFQYKYKPPSEELCARVNAIQMPADLCDWAVKMLSEGQEKVL